MTIFDPRVWLALIVFTLAGFGLGNWHGSAEAKKDAQIAETRRSDAAKAELVVETDKQQRAANALREADRIAHDKSLKEKDDALASKNAFIVDLQRDVKRLRVPVRPVRQGTTVEGGPAAAGPGDEGHAELTADGAQFLVDILARGDEGIRKHAEVVDRYERLRLACMGLPVPPTAPSAQPTGESP